MELKKLYKQITNEASKNNVQINDDELIRCKLKRFSLQVTGSRDKDVLTKVQYRLIKVFTNRDDIIARKSDKSNTCVIMDRSDYEAKLSLNVGDTTKFSQIDKYSTETLKKKIEKPNTYASNLSANDLKLSKLLGHYKSGY